MELQSPYPTTYYPLDWINISNHSLLLSTKKCTNTQNPAISPPAFREPFFCATFALNLFKNTNSCYNCTISFIITLSSFLLFNFINYSFLLTSLDRIPFDPKMV
uniref:Uncharacterized protein n=1 Tax=Cacopsylla melanoneura TaxID=428564 RepID=A0A8D8Z8E1_9HEMI